MQMVSIVDRYIASFAGFAPYEQPKYVVVVIVEEPEVLALWWALPRQFLKILFLAVNLLVYLTVMLVKIFRQ